MADRPSFPPAVLEALRKGNKLEALRLLKEAGKAGVAEAKSMVEAAQRAKAAGEKPAAPRAGPAPVGATAAAPSKPIPGYVPHSLSGLSPGEVPRGGGQSWWVLVLVLGVVAFVVLGYVEAPIAPR